MEHQFITNVKEIKTSEKSSTIIMEYVMRDENLIEKFMTITIFSQEGWQSSRVEGITGHLGNNK